MKQRADIYWQKNKGERLYLKSKVRVGNNGIQIGKLRKEKKKYIEYPNNKRKQRKMC